MLTILTQAFRRTTQNWKMVLVIFLVNFGLGLILAFPAFNILQAESDNSLAFNNLIADLDFTVFSDFLRISGKALKPLLPIGLILTTVYAILNIFFSGGILSQFTIRDTFRLFDFLKNSAHHFVRFLLLFLVQLLFLLFAAIVSLVLFGVFGAIGWGDTELKFFAWMIPPIAFLFFYLTYLFNVGEYAKVLLHRDALLNPWKAFWKASNYVFRNFKTMQVYWSVLLVTFLFLLFYLWLESSIGMTSGFTIWLMFFVQQSFIFGRVFIRIWNLSNTFDYLSLRPIPLTVKPVIITPIIESSVIEDNNNETNAEEGEQENKLSE
jgi:hypothetical protein